MANNFLPFCPTDTGTNLLTQSDYAAASDRTNGNQPGVASAKLVNKAIRQATYVAAEYAQFLADQSGTDILDDATPAKLLAQINMVQKPIAPIIQAFTSGSGTWNKSYYFGIASGSATTGATYTNNGFTFTVIATVASGVQVSMRGTGAPTVSGTLTKSGGTGDATLTFYAVRAPLYLKVRAVGGGGGGAGSGTTGTGSATAGGTTTFGTTMVSAVGGALGQSNGSGGNGGSATLGTGPTGTAVAGGSGSGCGSGNVAGGNGGGSFFAGGGGGGFSSGTGEAGKSAATNSGAGGGGAGAPSGGFCGGGGGAGGFADALITTVLATYAYAVGAAGAAGTAGTLGGNGGAGSAGYIEVTELFQ